MDQLTPDQVADLENWEAKTGDAERLLGLARIYVDDNAGLARLAHVPAPAGTEADKWSDAATDPHRPCWGSRRVVEREHDDIDCHIMAMQTGDGRAERFIVVGHEALTLDAARQLATALQALIDEAEAMGQFDAMRQYHSGGFDGRKT
jgi:hypothetical protein